MLIGFAMYRVSTSNMKLLDTQVHNCRSCNGRRDCYAVVQNCKLH